VEETKESAFGVPQFEIYYLSAPKLYPN